MKFVKKGGKRSQASFQQNSTQAEEKAVNTVWKTEIPVKDDFELNCLKALKFSAFKSKTGFRVCGLLAIPQARKSKGFFVL